MVKANRIGSGKPQMVLLTDWMLKFKGDTCSTKSFSTLCTMYNGRLINKRSNDICNMHICKLVYTWHRTKTYPYVQLWKLLEIADSCNGILHGSLLYWICTHSGEILEKQFCRMVSLKLLFKAMSIDS